MDKPSLNIVRAADIAAHAQEFSHPWNPHSLMRGTQLARSVGLKRTGVNFIRVPPGKESYVYHSHRYEEEWIYVLSGRAIALIDDAEYEVGAGRLHRISRAVGGAPLRNPGPDDLVYLSRRREPRVRSRGFSRRSASAWCAWASRSTSTTSTMRKPFGPLIRASAAG